MRVPISQKLFSAFISVFAVTVAIAVILFYGIVELGQTSRDIGVLKDLKLTVRSIEIFATDVHGNITTEESNRIEKSFDELTIQLRQLRDFGSSLPEKILNNVIDLESQVKYYKQAHAEYARLQKLDSSLHANFYASVGKVAKASAKYAGDDGRDLVSTLMMSGGLVVHEKDVKALGEMKERLKEGRGSIKSPLLGDALENLVGDAEKSFINHLALVEQENYIASVSRRFSDVANKAITSLENQADHRNGILQKSLLASIFLLAAIMMAWWTMARRHANKFIETSNRMVDTLRRGNYEVRCPKTVDDEFGDLLKFIEEMASDLKKSHNLLLASEAKYKSMVENIADWVWECDGEGIMVYSSPVSLRLLGIAPQDVLGRPVCPIVCPSLSREDFASHKKIIEESGAPKTLLSESSKADGSVIFLESVIELNDDAPTGFRGVTRDVTERVSAEREQAKLREQLLHAQKMEAVGTLAGGVAHDFNNLLQSIGGYADLLLGRGDLTPRDRAAVERIVEATSHAASLTRQLLFYSRKAGTNFTTIDLNALILHSVELLERTIPKMIRVKTDLDPSLPLITGDPVQLEHIFLNLAINARDAMPHGGEISIRTTAETAPGEIGKRAYMIFSDTGVGIPRENIDHIFEPFFTTKETGKGTGLGLAMVYGIVKSHGGAISVESERGGGTTFTVALPISINPGDGGKADENEPERGEFETGTIMLVDDESQIREICKEALEQAGFRTLAASSGEEAVAIYEKEGSSVDLVILDLNMPGMGGSKCCKTIRGMNPKAKIIIASGYSEDESGFSSASGFDIGFLRKPYRINALLEAIRKALGG